MYAQTIDFTGSPVVTTYGDLYKIDELGYNQPAVASVGLDADHAAMMVCSSGTDNNAYTTNENYDLYIVKVLAGGEIQVKQVLNDIITTGAENRHSINICYQAATNKVIINYIYANANTDYNRSVLYTFDAVGGSVTYDSAFNNSDDGYQYSNNRTFIDTEFTDGTKLVSRSNTHTSADRNDTCTSVYRLNGAKISLINTSLGGYHAQPIALGNDRLITFYGGAHSGYAVHTRNETTDAFTTDAPKTLPAHLSGVNAGANTIVWGTKLDDTHIMLMTQEENNSIETTPSALSYKTYYNLHVLTVATDGTLSPTDNFGIKSTRRMNQRIVAPEMHQIDNTTFAMVGYFDTSSQFGVDIISV